MARTAALTAILLWIVAIFQHATAHAFDEHLLLRPLPDGRVLTHFQFDVRD
jgi:hypothetical protein